MDHTFCFPNTHWEATRCGLSSLIRPWQHKKFLGNQWSLVHDESLERLVLPLRKESTASTGQINLVGEGKPRSKKQNSISSGMLVEGAFPHPTIRILLVRLPTQVILTGDKLTFKPTITSRTIQAAHVLIGTG